MAETESPLREPSGGSRARDRSRTALSPPQQPSPRSPRRDSAPRSNGSMPTENELSMNGDVLQPVRVRERARQFLRAGVIDMPPPNAMRQKWRILTLRESANEFICHFCAQAKSSADLPGANRVEPQPSNAAEMEAPLWRVTSWRMNTSACAITRSKTDPLCRKGTGPVWRRCANSTFGSLASPRLGNPGVVPRKNGGCEHAHRLKTV